MTDAVDVLLSPISGDQENLLRVIFGPMREYGKWPNWLYVSSTFGKTNKSADAVVKSLPVAVTDQAHNRGYGLLRFDDIHPASHTTVRLTVAASLHLPEFQEYGRFFLRILRIITEHVKYAPVTPFEVEPIQLTRSMFQEKDGFLDDGLLRLVPEILQAEPVPFLNSSGHPTDSGEWFIAPNREFIEKFDGVESIEEYVRRLVGWLEEISASQVSPVAELEEVVAASPAVTSSYVQERVIVRLEAAQDETKLNLKKLLALIHELNANYQLKNVYACHALLRAILDHIPPIFQMAKFSIVANQYGWGRSDKNYMKLLEEVRVQGDDALHRMIGEREDLLDFDHLPSGMGINRLLDEVVEILGKKSP